jgi:hypothetical protein
LRRHLSRDWQDFSQPFVASTYMSSSQGHWIILVSTAVPRKDIQSQYEEMMLSVRPTSSRRYRVAEAGYLRKRGASRKDWTYLLKINSRSYLHDGGAPQRPSLRPIGPGADICVTLSLLLVHTWQLSQRLAQLSFLYVRDTSRQCAMAG